MSYQNIPPAKMGFAALNHILQILIALLAAPAPAQCSGWAYNGDNAAALTKGGIYNSSVIFPFA